MILNVNLGLGQLVTDAVKALKPMSKPPGISSPTQTKASDVVQFLSENVDAAYFIVNLSGETDGKKAFSYLGSNEILANNSFPSLNFTERLIGVPFDDPDDKLRKFVFAIHPFTTHARGEFARLKTHFAIMRDAKEKNFNRILLVENGVTIDNASNLPSSGQLRALSGLLQDRNLDNAGVKDAALLTSSDAPQLVVLGGKSSMTNEFTPLPQTPWIKEGNVDAMHACIMNRAFLTRCSAIDEDLLDVRSIDKLYASCRSLCLTQPLFIRRSYDDIPTFPKTTWQEHYDTRAANLYRRLTDMSATSVMHYAIAILLIVMLLLLVFLVSAA